MVVIAFRFPAGRYHATPWGRAVNEAQVAWPPEPWRIVRALIAVWHNRFRVDDGSDETLASLVDKLAACLPVYTLPAAVHTHSRHYMPVGQLGKDGREKTTLIFDAFLRLSPADPLYVTWEGVDLSEDETRLLDRLLSALPYLGRAESWVEASRCEGFVPEPNCVPLERREHSGGGNGDFEPIHVLAPLTAAQWWERRRELLEAGPTRGKKAQQYRNTLPERLLDAVAVGTAQLTAAKWSGGAARGVARDVVYLRPAGIIGARYRGSDVVARSEVTTVLLQLMGKPLPRVEDAIRVGEAVRRAVLAVAGGRGQRMAPPELSGHDGGGGGGHRHAFYLPFDADEDGRIDHVMLHAEAGLGPEAQAALARLRVLRLKDGVTLQVVCEGLLTRSALTGAEGLAPVWRRLLGPARRWRSATPYLCPWYRKNGFGPAEQLRREIGGRANLAELTEAHPLPAVCIAARRLRPVHFHRFRNRRGLRQPDTQGRFVELEFARTVRGPVALGFGCHFGLGLFVPAGS